MEPAFADHRGLREQFDLLTFGHRNGTGPEKKRRVTDCQLVLLLHGTDLELTAQEPHQRYERNQRPGQRLRVRQRLAAGASFDYCDTGL